MDGIDQAALLAAWLIVCVFTSAAISSTSRILSRTFVFALTARTAIGIAQSGYSLFLPNADSVGYVARGQLILTQHSFSKTLAGVDKNQVGIIATNAWVSLFRGPVPTMVMMSFLAALVSSLAVVVALMPFFRNVDDSADIGRSRMVLLVVAVLSPSLLFWGSQDLKEPFLMLGIALFVYGFHSGWPSRAIYPMIGVLLCLAYRPYIGALVLAVGVLFVLVRLGRRRFPRASLAFAVGTALVLSAIYAKRVVGVDISEQQVYSQLAGGNSVVDVAGGQYGGLGRFGQIFFSSLPWQIPHGLQGMLAYVESLALGGLMILYLVRMMRRQYHLRNDGVLITLLLYITAATIYARGLANSGTLARERSPFLLVLLPLLFLPLDHIFASQIAGNGSARQGEVGVHAGGPFVRSFRAKPVKLRRHYDA